MKQKNMKPDSNSLTAVEQQWNIPVIDLVTPTAQKKRDYKQDIDYNRLRALVSSHADKLEDAEGIMELLPDLELVRETLVATILSPKDLQEVNLNITVHKDAPAEIAEIVREHFTNEYDLNSKLSSILAQALFTKGSYILMPIPPSAVTRLVKANTTGMENVHFNSRHLPNINILYTKTKPQLYALEAVSTALPDHTHDDKDLIEISDNIVHLAYPVLRNGASKKRVNRLIKDAYGLEGEADKVPNEELYKDRPVKTLPFVIIDENKNEYENINPIVLTLPPESVIPVHTPGEPSAHVGYYVFLDEDGNPLHFTKSSNKFKEMNNKLDQTVSKQTVMNTIGIGVNYSNSTGRINSDESANTELMRSYYRKFEQELVDAVSKGATGKNVQISEPGELYRVMFARQLEKQKTRVIYVPAEMITYIAFNYNESGVGISLLEKTKLYASFRAILMFATVMAGIKSSVNSRTVGITLDAADPDPTGTVEQILNEYIALNASGMPIGRLNPLDIVDSLQKAGMQIKITGSDRFPTTEVDVHENKREITPPDSNIMDMLKDIHYAGLWTNRESVDKTGDADFATSIVASNLLEAKRMHKCQKDYITALTSFMHKYIYMGGPLFNAIKRKYEELKTDKLTLEEVIDSITLSLPKADTSVIKEQKILFDDYCQFLDIAIESYLSETMIKDMLTGENINGTLEDVKLAVLHMLKRQWLRAQNMLPELDNLLLNEDGATGMLIEQHNESIVKLAGNILRSLRLAEKTDDDKTKAIMDSLQPEDTSDGQEEDTYNEDDDSSDTDTVEGSDDFDTGDDTDGTGSDEDLSGPDSEDDNEDGAESEEGTGDEGQSVSDGNPEGESVDELADEQNEAIEDTEETTESEEPEAGNGEATDEEVNDEPDDTPLKEKEQTDESTELEDPDDSEVDESSDTGSEEEPPMKDDNKKDEVEDSETTDDSKDDADDVEEITDPDEVDDDSKEAPDSKPDIEDTQEESDSEFKERIKEYPEPKQKVLIEQRNKRKEAQLAKDKEAKEKDEEKKEK